MPNRPRPRCPTCSRAMEPVFRKRVSGRSYARLPEIFWCDDCSALARGRSKTRYVA